MSYNIMWNDGDNATEQIDEADTKEEAEYLRQEYQLAYKGYVWIK